MLSLVESLGVASAEEWSIVGFEAEMQLPKSKAGVHTVNDIIL